MKKKSECSEPLYITMKFNLLFQEVKHQIGSFPWSFHDNDRKFAFERNGYFFNCLQITLTHNDCNRNGNFCNKFKCKWKLYKKKKTFILKMSRVSWYLLNIVKKVYWLVVFFFYLCSVKENLFKCNANFYCTRWLNYFHLLVDTNNIQDI